MERWNELVAGYVLGNLTDDESQELADILRNNPQLQLEISRLRQTATMNHAQLIDRPLASLGAGAEGWTDTVHDLPEVKPVQPVFPEKQPLLAAVAESGLKVDSAPAVESFWRRFSLAKEGSLQRTGLVSWVMALLLIGMGLDNWRVRRLLAIAQERILQLELSAEYQPGRAE